MCHIHCGGRCSSLCSQSRVCCWLSSLVLRWETWFAEYRCASMDTFSKPYGRTFVWGQIPAFSIGTPFSPACSLLLRSQLTGRSMSRSRPVSYTHLRAHETPEHLVCRLL